jgi:hypothetical protein
VDLSKKNKVKLTYKVGKDVDKKNVTWAWHRQDR